MTTLREYLDNTKCEDSLKDLIELIAKQAGPIRNAFITNQKYVDTKNIYGETQMELDKWSNVHLKKVLEQSGLVKELASEEEDEVVKFSGAKGNYAVTMDPLDGSSLIQVNLAVGTIVGIYDNGRVMQPGENMRAAMYILYGPMTVLTLTVKEGVHIFALNNDGEYVMMIKDLKVPEGKIYASGALKKDWLPKHKAFIEYLEGQGYKLRYSGSFVADVHQILKYGGMFSYPAFQGHDKGKLRLLFEANPLGFIMTRAGGRISDGARDILSIMPEKVDHRVPIYIGTRSVIEQAEEMLK
ncbi:MAG: fructose-1,6-bisphosphatase [Candidatus Altiarchaeota archaeon]|nr:fructose-1,6-bisphosphatase [Candidatus Altiarchaeota archaeon]